MTVGEKIKYCRQELALTQDELAELSGIHPVSIRKYETNKMMPQQEHIEKIARALGISPIALCDPGSIALSLETVGDLMGIIISLCKAGILSISGTRDEATYLLDADTVSIQFNSNLSYPFEISSTNKVNLSFPGALLIIKDNDLLALFLQWEKFCFLSKEHQKIMDDDPSTKNQEDLDLINRSRDMVELELQRQMEFLDGSGRKATQKRLVKTIEIG